MTKIKEIYFPSESEDDEIVRYVESLKRVHIERMLFKGNTYYVSQAGEWSSDIKIYLEEYLEFLDRCDEEKALQEQEQTKARSYEKWGMFQ